MKVSIVFGSHKNEGKNKEIETAVKNLDMPHDFDFIRLSEMNISKTILIMNLIPMRNMKMMSRNMFWIF